MPDDLKDIFNIKDYSEIEFKKIHGFVFVFKTKIIVINDMLSSAEIKPLAIIYEENDDFYLAPPDALEDIESIVEEFVKNYMLK